MTNPTSQTAEPAVLPERPYAAAVTAVLRELRVEPASGLSAPEATRRLKQYGPNELLTHPPTTAARILVNQLKGAVVWLLATAAAVAALFGEWAEAIAILLPIDRLLDTLLTSVNVEGDMVGSLVVQKLVGASHGHAQS